MIKESVLILGGGSDQKLLVEEFNNRGYKTIVIDYYDNPPAKAIAGLHYKISTYDEVAIKAIAIRHAVKLITTISTDQPLFFAAKVSFDLGLYFHISKDQALALTNKRFMKETFDLNGIPTAKHVVLEAEDIERKNFRCDHLSFPLIVKPVDSSGSRGISKIADKTALSDCLTMAIVHSRSKQIIVEEFIEGQELSVDAMVIDSVSNLIMISDNHKVENIGNQPLFSRSIFPSSISNEAINNVKVVCQQLAIAFNLVNSPLFVQVIVKENKVFVLELSARIAGGSKPYFIKAAINYNIVKSFVNLLLGKKVELPDYNFLDNSFVCLKYIYSHPGIIKKIIGDSQLKENNIIEELILYRNIGDLSVGPKDGSSRIGVVVIKANTLSNLRVKIDHFNNSFKIKTNNCTNIFINESK
jgi:formate-dependent phosphoribosylglycinamide formyltransferase (GAR transformylase)